MSNKCDETDEYFMRKALEQACIALEKDEVPVGCVIVYDDPCGEKRIIGTGYNKTNESRNVHWRLEKYCLF